MAFGYDLNGSRLEVSTQDGRLTRYGKTLNLTEYIYDANGNRLIERMKRPHAVSVA